MLNKIYILSFLRRPVRKSFTQKDKEIARRVVVVVLLFYVHGKHLTGKLKKRQDVDFIQHVLLHPNNGIGHKIYIRKIQADCDVRKVWPNYACFQTLSYMRCRVRPCGIRPQNGMSMVD